MSSQARFAVHDGYVSPNADVAAGSIQYDAHPLDSAPSPLLRALPAYEREFRSHLRRAQALQAVGAARLAAAEQLIAEMVGTGSARRFVYAGADVACTMQAMHLIANRWRWSRTCCSCSRQPCSVHLTVYQQVCRG